MKKLSWQLLLGGLVSAACLFSVLKGISWKEIIIAFQNADFRWVIGSVLIYFFAYLFRSYRWKILLAPLAIVKTINLLPVLILGFFGNNILPLRMGELLRVHLCGKKFGISRVSVLGTVFIERLCDLISFLLSFTIVTLFLTFPPAFTRAAYGSAAIAIGIFLCLLVSIRYKPQILLWILRLQKGQGLAVKLHALINKFLDGISGLTKLSLLFKALSMSAIIWLIEGTFIFGMAQAFIPTFSFAGAFFILFFIGVSVALPQAPGYVGTMELFGVMGFSFLGISKDIALPIMLAIHGTQLVFILIAGVIAMASEGIGWDQFKNASKSNLT